MAIGWIRAYAEEDTAMGALGRMPLRADRAAFRASFKTEILDAANSAANLVKSLKWGAAVTLPNGLSGGEWTAVTSGNKQGFIKSAHLVEVAFVKRKKGTKKDFVATLDTERKDPNSGVVHKDKRDLIWGDLAQITKPGTRRCDVRARGAKGKMNVSDLTSDALLEVYFVDVGQGDGILVRTPDGRHMMVDGGLERNKQQTGKNAADFVDWKFFFDYGHYRIKLESMLASHSDNDHYGGLHDLVRTSEMAERELDCLGVDIDVLHHPGLSRWSNNKNANPKHKDGLGAHKDGAYIQLLGDRADAEKAVSKTATEKLSGPWKRFISDVLKNSKRTKVERLVLEQASLSTCGLIPKLWPTQAGCSIHVLGPIAKKVGAKLGLPNFGKKSFNTNGPISSINVRKRAWRSRIMEKNHYGLVNVRTDGKTIMCATLAETEEKWVIHTFPARFV